MLMINPNERNLLRDLAIKTKDISELPVMEERRQMWTRHNGLERVRPMILVFPEGAWNELLPETALKCENALARKIEWELRRRIYQHEFIDDDMPIEKEWNVHKKISGMDSGDISLNVNWGVEIKRHASSRSTGSYGFDPVLKDFSDIKRLKVPELYYDEAATLQELDLVENVLGDILDVKLKGFTHVSFHFMYYYTALRGLEQMMYDLYDEPEFVHEVMSFFEEGYGSIIRQCTEQNLFSLNNDSTYQSTGGTGFSRELPQKDFAPGKVCPIDMWASAESQEMSHVSPKQHEDLPCSTRGGYCHNSGLMVMAVAILSTIRWIMLPLFQICEGYLFLPGPMW